MTLSCLAMLTALHDSSMKLLVVLNKVCNNTLLLDLATANT